MKVRPVRTRVFREEEDLIAFIRTYIPTLAEGSVLAVTSKIVALAEGRTAAARTKKEKERLVTRESEWAKQAYPDWWLTVRDGVFLVNAGIDESNADGKIVLLPKDCYRSAAKARDALKKAYGVKKLGVVITDSHVMPLRNGVFGTALGHAGFKGIRDYRGERDIFGRSLEVTQVGVADSLATAAALVMGEGGERQPLAVIEGAPVEFCEKVNPRELRIDSRKDIFRAIMKPLPFRQAGVGGKSTRHRERR